jgi:hypothetical protein
MLFDDQFLLEYHDEVINNDTCGHVVNMCFTTISSLSSRSWDYISSRKREARMGARVEHTRRPFGGDR